MRHNDREILRRCRSAVGRLSLPSPFSVAELGQRLAQQRRRPLYVHPLPVEAAASGACGLWLATQADDHIFVEEGTSPPHREHIVLHEIGHMIFDHHPLEPGGDTAVVAPFLPDLDARLVERLLARARYSTRQEREAEILASLIQLEAARMQEGSQDGGPGRLEAVFGFGADHGG